MRQKTKKNLNLMVGICLVFLGFLIHTFYWGRIILIIWGTICLVKGATYKYRKRIIQKILVTTLIAIISIFAIDTFLALVIKIEPVIALYYQTTNIKIYNAIGYRTWRCQDNKIVIDYFYQKEFLCDERQVKTLEINTFANHIISNYAEYDNQFIKVKGRISRIDGLNDLEMQPYTKQDNSINGYVQFTADVTLRVNFASAEEKLTNYELYDIVTVIGRIKDINQSQEQSVINMIDSQIITDDSYLDFNLSLASEKLLNEELKLTYTSSKIAIWNMFANPIMITFNNQEVYELEFVLSSNKLAVNQVLAKADSTETNYEQTIIAYYYPNYKIFVGQKKQQTILVIANLKTTFADIKQNYIQGE